MNKKEILEDLDLTISSLKAIRDDTNAWDIYDDKNWTCIIKTLNEAKHFIQRRTP